MSSLKHQLVLLIIAIFQIESADAQLIISEYLEGASFDKCVEIFNPGSTSVNLTGHTIDVYSNGSSTVSSSISLSGSIAPCGTFVVCHTSANAGLLAISDQTSGSANFNGDDAVALMNGGTMLDLIGNIGEDPGSEWTGVGGGTANEGIIRNSNYCAGVTTDPGGTGFPSFTAANWSAVGQTGATLGAHTSSCCATVNSITTGTVTGSPFNVECVTSSTDNGTVDFTSTGTFNAGNIYTAELSDATGNFASPTVVGTLNSVANSGTINITIPANMPSGVGYLIRVVSDNPVITGSNSLPITINQNLICSPTLPANGLVINEWSNGPTGNQEYYEFVVTGQCGQSVDIRNYILDDNNATFTNPADYDATASGIAPGHFRFTNDAQWGNIPVGSVIVIYNADDPNGDLPADDPTDADNDSLYVVPHTSTLFERCTTLPISASPDSIYAPCTYSTAPLTGWGALSLRNSGDAIQVRQPNGDYYHGVSYGGSEMTGGPDNMKLFTGSGTDMAGWFNSGDIFDITDWSSGNTTGNQTPGTANNAANYSWLLLMRDTTQATCPVTILPVEMIEFKGINAPEGNILHWSTASERNSDYFIIERSTDGKKWSEVSMVNSIGNSNEINSYQTVDVTFSNDYNYYRLIQIDEDGSRTKYSKHVTIDNTEKDGVELIGIFNLLGQKVDASFNAVQIRLYSDGTTQRVYKN